MNTYIINAPILTSYGRWEFSGPLSVPEVQTILQDGFISAIGHQASAQVLSEILQVDIPVNRIHITMDVGDRALIMRLLQRLPEGKILDRQELKAVPFEIGLLKRTR